jgi:chemotaxis protein MotB
MGKKKCPEPDCPKCLPGWLAAFGDLMSLLLCFFVLLLSMSTMDAKKIQEAVGSLSGALSVLEGGVKTEISNNIVQQATPIESTTESTTMVKTMQQTVNEINEMSQMQGGQEVTLEETEEGFLIRLPSSLLFRKGVATIENEDAILFLKRIALLIEKMPQDMMINAIGHTDNTPPNTDSPYKDNWELSTARGVNVVKELILNQVNPKRLISSGKGEFQPITSNLTNEGRAKNRRVELYFFSKNDDNKNKAQKSVLDK